MEKKSVLLAEVFPVSNEEEGLRIWKKSEKNTGDARHHCWAYVIGRIRRQRE